MDLPQSLTVREAVEAFLASRSHLRPATQETYADVLHGLTQGLPLSLVVDSVAPKHLYGFIHDLTIRRATQRKRYTHLRVFFRWAVKDRLIKKSPLAKVRQPRAEKKAVVFLTNEDLQRLHTERKDDLDGPVLLDGRELPIKPDRVSKRFKTMVRLAKLDDRLHFHSLRHTCGSWLAMKGVPLRIIQAILGHASITTTEIYAHLSPDTMQAAMQQVFGRG